MLWNSVVVLHYSTVNTLSTVVPCNTAVFGSGLH